MFRLPCAALVLCGLASSARAEQKDTAELFPAQTLAYLEFRQPDKLSREAATLIKGSALEDMPVAAITSSIEVAWKPSREKHRHALVRMCWRRCSRVFSLRRGMTAMLNEKFSLRYRPEGWIASSQNGKIPFYLDLG